MREIERMSQLIDRLDSYLTERNKEINADPLLTHDMVLLILSELYRFQKTIRDIRRELNV